MPSLFDSGRAF